MPHDGRIARVSLATLMLGLALTAHPAAAHRAYTGPTPTATSPTPVRPPIPVLCPEGAAAKSQSSGVWQELQSPLASVVGQAAPAPPVPIHLQKLGPGTFLSETQVYGDTVAWVDQGSLDQRNRLYLAPLGHFQPRLVALGAPCDRLNEVHLSNRWLVWSASGGASGRLLWAFDRWTDKRSIIDRQPAVNGVNPFGEGAASAPSLSLDGGVVVWSRLLAGPSSDAPVTTLLMRTLPNGPVQTVLRNTDRCSYVTAPHLSGALLVWERGHWLHELTSPGVGHIPSCYNNVNETGEPPLTDVVVENLHNRVTRLLTPAHGGSDPLTDGRYVAWRQCRATCHRGDQLVLYDTLSGRRTIIAPNGFSTATLNGDVLVWSIWNRTESSIHALDLGTGRRSLLAREIDPNHFISGRTQVREVVEASGLRAAWIQNVRVEGRSRVTYVALANLPSKG